MGVGNLVPMICDGKIGSLYGLKNNVDCLTYENTKGFIDMMIRAIEMSQPEYDSMVQNVKNIYDRWMESNIKNVKRWFP